MKSTLAAQKRQALIQMARQMSPAERLKAFAEHSRLLVQLKEAGDRYRRARRRRSLSS